MTTTSLPAGHSLILQTSLVCVIWTDEKGDRSLIGFVLLLPHSSASFSFLIPYFPSSFHPSPKSPECERLHLFLQKLFCSAIKHSSPQLPRKLEACVITGIMDGAQSPGPGVQRLNAHPCGQAEAASWRTMWGCSSDLSLFRTQSSCYPPGDRHVLPSLTCSGQLTNGVGALQTE